MNLGGNRKMSAKSLFLSFAAALLFTTVISAADPKPAEIIEKHLNSFATAEKRKSLENMLLIGISDFNSKLPERKSQGRMVIASDAANFMILSSFAAVNYPFERIGMFGGKVNVPFVVSGVRSPLGDFLNEHPRLLTSGLFGGSMSLQWNFLERNTSKGNMNGAGTKKVDGRKAYVVDFYTQGNSDSLSIQMFFDAENFRHLRTRYREVVAGKEAVFGQLGRETGYELILTEDFSDFITQDGVTLPTKTKIHYVSNSGRGTFEYDWVFKVTEVQFNQKLKENFFVFN